MDVVSTFAECRDAHAGITGLVPTMGYLHEGHLSLIECAARDCDTVIVSLFVNPLQFGQGEDLARYPADLERDRELAAKAGADVLFAPVVGDVYPEPPVTTVSVTGIAGVLEGAHRPGHMDGVAIVVTKLFAGVQPDRAYFGRKDAQQLAMVRRLGADLSLPVLVAGCPTVRERDGLALSSRNTYLSADDRTRALALSRGLMTAADAAEAGERDGSRLAALVTGSLEAEGVAADYVALASQADVRPLDAVTEPAFLAVAARVGAARLIDNIHIDLVDGRLVADRGVRLDHPSVLYGGTA